MAYFELLQRDYSDWMAQSAAAGQAVAPLDAAAAVIDRALSTVLESALFDIEQAGVFCAVSASLAGAMQTPAGERLPASHLATYAPVEDDAYPYLKRRLIETGAPSEIVVALETHHARVNFARKLTRALLTAPPDAHSAAAGDEIEKLHDAWCRACAAALNASRTVRAALARSGAPVARAPFEGREAVMHQAAKGARPCIDAGGGITVPGWAEKRKAARYLINRPAQVKIDGVTFPVVIKDASVSGLGLLKAPGNSAPGLAVTVILDGGDVVTGRIAWCRSGAAGVALDTPLPPDHALFAELAG